MKHWTPAAHQELEQALAEHHARLVGTGVDADEVVADLRRHIETEYATRPAPTPGEVRMALHALLGHDDEGGAGVARSETQTADALQDPRLRQLGFLWAFLVVLPLITLGFELATELCAIEFFDPIRGWIQLIAVASVPVLNAGILLLHGRWAHSERGLHGLRVAAALATGVCLFYAFQFLILTPFAFVGIIYLGLGLLPLAPLFGLIFGVGLMAQMRRQSRRRGASVRWVWPWVFASAVALLLADLGPLCASLGMRWYGSDDPTIHARGLALLRSPWIDPEHIEQPWRGGTAATGTHLLLNLVSGDAGPLAGQELDRARFAATGTVRNLADPDLWRRSRGRGRAGEGRWSLLGDLALDGSRLDGSVDPDLLYGYVEWTMTLRNSENWPLEGRATVQLPPGGVVSRVTLWIDAEEREAAFAGRAAATKAYESVAIVQRRDPILVTTAGPDGVRLRCFPVPSQGEMKFRLGITFPLLPTPDGSAAEVALPSIQDANFLVPSRLRHHVWIGRADGESTRADDVDTKPLRGPVGRDGLATTLVRVRRDASRTRAVGRAFDDGTVITQELRATLRASRRITLVLDGNPRVLRECASSLIAALELKEVVPVDVWLALEQPVHRPFSTPEQARAFLAEALAAREVHDDSGVAHELPRRGGFDNGPALASALTAATREAGGGVVLWLCGPQVSVAGSADAVRQVLERGGRGIELRVVPVLAGRNDLIEALDGRPEARVVGSCTAQVLQREVVRAAGAAGIEVVRAVHRPDAGVDWRSVAPTRHLARLWAADEVAHLAASGPAQRAEAVALAAKHQLVTSVSGAVVLETEAQYNEHGLTPVDAASVPTVPETGSVVVVLLAALALGGALWVRRRTAGAPCR